MKKSKNRKKKKQKHILLRGSLLSRQTLHVYAKEKKTFWESLKLVECGSLWNKNSFKWTRWIKYLLKWILKVPKVDNHLRTDIEEALSPPWAPITTAPTLRSHLVRDSCGASYFKTWRSLFRRYLQGQFGFPGKEGSVGDPGVQVCYCMGINLSVSSAYKFKTKQNCQILFWKILYNKQHHREVLLKSFHLNGDTLGFHP